ncbi:hypothetical protein ACWD6R_31400 [Streptomyces sp. NPDC005151]
MRGGLSCSPGSASALTEPGGIDLLVNNVGAEDDVQPVGFLDTDDTYGLPRDRE